MTALARSLRPVSGFSPVIFSLLVALSILATPLLAAMPVSADWGADIRLTNAAGDSYNPSVASSGNDVHVAWYDYRDGKYEIYYKRSTDGGTTWGADTRLTSAAGTPSIAVSGNNVHVAWYDDRDGNYEIYYKRSTDGGMTWGMDTRLTNAAANSANPAIVVSGNNVHVAWQDDRDGQWEIYYKRSTDGGATWGSDTRLSSDAGWSYGPSTVALGNHILVAWYDSRAGNYEIYYKRSTDGGAAWGAENRLTDAAGYSANPSAAASGNDVHIAWQDDRDGNNEIYYKRSMDGGTTWGADTRLTNAAGDSWFPSAAVSGDSVHVAWYDDRDGNMEIYYKRSTDGGATWGADTRLTNAAGNSRYPSMAVAGNNVHLAWRDDRDGNDEIYYKKDTAPAPTITSFSPAAGNPGTTVVITGANFTGATAVAFGGVPASGFTVDSDTQITAIVGNGLPGKITVTTPSGIGTSEGIFNFMNLAGGTPHGSSVSGGTTTASQQGPVPMASISVKNASLSADRVAPGGPVTVTANVVNSGTAGGSSSITVYVNGKEESSRGVEVSSGASTPVTFEISRSQPGTYTVCVGNTSAGSFTVDALADPDIVLYISGALVLFAIVIGVVYASRRNQAR